MKISIIGSGYVGLVSGAGLAEAGHNVICMDIDTARIEKLRKGISPIVQRGIQSGIPRRGCGNQRFHVSQSHCVWC